MLRRAVRLTVAAVVVLACLAQVSATTLGPDLVQNGGFETGNFEFWTLSGLIDGFTFVGSPGFHSNFAAYLGAIRHPAGPGSHSHPGNNQLIQNLSGFVSGASYEISFWLANTGQPNQFDVLLDGVLLEASHDVPNQAFTHYSFVHKATSHSHSLKIQFNSFNDPSFLVLDDVSVRQVIA